MAFTFTKTEIPNLIVVETTIHGDSRGTFQVTYEKKLFEQNQIPNDFVQDNRSTSDFCTLRGLHYQAGDDAQAKLVGVTRGAVLDVAVDLRKDSNTFGKYFAILLTGTNGKQLYIPRGFAHGFVVISPGGADFSYKCDNYYNSQSERGLIWNDPEININWELDHYFINEDNLIISDKDQEWPTFNELKKNNLNLF